ncbi:MULTISPECIES: hypothetical protein [Staphylococcus]|nr:MULTISPECIES: hypothetical protein [Staphylococcus]MBW6090115.1 hypothetical protein [Staphylococcus chromogenes]MCD9060033.1 hypothetical protein [Staphylococcus chromogenes]MCD9062284.1 hypothetical protein [Staphylococcus chromogenes]MCE4961973.1 hypothetical protein [Staphylococcus chromogenes]MCE4970635.1 hypothetical protein [Staphylococcus chromogenes]
MMSFKVLIGVMIIFTLLSIVTVPWLYFQGEVLTPTLSLISLISAWMVFYITYRQQK